MLCSSDVNGRVHQVPVLQLICTVCFISSGKLMRLWLHVANRLKALRHASLAIESSNARRVAAGALATWRQQYGLKRKHHTALLRAVGAMMNCLKRQAFTSLRAHVEKKKQVWLGR